MPIKKELPTDRSKEGIIEAQGLIVPDELDDLPTLVAAMRAQSPSKYKDALPIEIIQAIGRGELRGVKPAGHSYGYNQILQAYWDKEFLYNQGIAPTPYELQFKQFGVGTRFTKQTTITTLGKEIARATPSYIQPDGSSNIYTSSYFNKTQANPAVTTVTSATLNTITVASTAGVGWLLVAPFGNRIQIQTSQATYTATVIGVSGLTLTINDIQGGGLVHAAAFLPTDIPQVGNFVSVMHCEGGIFMGPLATTSLDVGTLANWRPFEFAKVRPSILVPTNTVSVIYNVVFLNISLP